MHASAQEKKLACTLCSSALEQAGDEDLIIKK